MFVICVDGDDDDDDHLAICKVKNILGMHSLKNWLQSHN